MLLTMIKSESQIMIPLKTRYTKIWCNNSWHIRFSKSNMFKKSHSLDILNLCTFLPRVLLWGCFTYKMDRRIASFMNQTFNGVLWINILNTMDSETKSMPLTHHSRRYMCKRIIKIYRKTHKHAHLVPYWSCLSLL